MSCSACKIAKARVISRPTATRRIGGTVKPNTASPMYLWKPPQRQMSSKNLNSWIPGRPNQGHRSKGLSSGTTPRSRRAFLVSHNHNQGKGNSNTQAKSVGTIPERIDRDDPLDWILPWGRFSITCYGDLMYGEHTVAIITPHGFELVPTARKTLYRRRYALKYDTHNSVPNSVISGHGVVIIMGPTTAFFERTGKVYIDSQILPFLK